MRIARHRRVRARVFGVTDKPRLSIFRSNRHLSAQIIDDLFGKVLVSAWTKELAPEKGSVRSGAAKKIASGVKHLANSMASAAELGAIIAKKAVEKKIKQVVFDRGGYAYHGKVKAFAEGARKGGLVF